MPNKNKYNPSKKPVLTKSKGKKGEFLKNIERNTKRLTIFKK